MLPDVWDEGEYWRSVYSRPLEFWLPALHEISRRHELPPGEWRRFELGRNVVLGNGAAVVKLGPPFWAEDIAREAGIVQFVAGRLPVRTATALAEGKIDTWGYMAQTELPGVLMRSAWPQLDGAERAALARQHGELMAALHALAADDPEAPGGRDWHAMVAEQAGSCAERMRSCGVPEALLADLPRYLRLALPLTEAPQPMALLHGDLDAINMLIEPDAGNWRIVALVDWSDAGVGPAAHEFISPCVHSYLGDREVLRAWYAGYGLGGTHLTEELQRHLMARAMIYYAGEFDRYLARVPGAAECASWDEIAPRFWHMG